ncbi:DUF4407 domain-containing protein [Nocardia carnea]|uniref:DUF4407 domain-containing protein n=1 Tax=Nocardia carnea TaxID=37328 RepID=UPI0024553A64|nr:DUF4407 domain-containing protein [Nocardia carnea]
MSVTGMFIWLGGGQPTETADGYERTGYLLTGVGVALFAVVSAGVTGVALRLGAWSLPVVAVAALIAGLFAGLIGRALAGAEATARPDRPAGETNTPAVALRLGVAVIAGVLVAELATTVLFAGTIDRILDDRAAAAALTAPAVRPVQDELDRAIDQRAALDRTIAAAEDDIDTALVVARCEFNPTPECPQTKITGVPGRGPETQTANEMLDDARNALAAAQNQVAPSDRQVADARAALQSARAAAEAEADRGLGARWSAANDHTSGVFGALIIRLLTWLFFILLAALALILRWWRGETAQERRRAAAAVRDRAERAADAAVAEQQARLRAETAAVRVDQQLAEARLAAEADTAIAREQQRTRVIAAIGGLEIGVTERGADAADSTRPAGTELERVDRRALPAPVGSRPSARPDDLVLPLIGTVPFTGTAARMIRPLVPGFVSSAVDNALDVAGRPLRTARHVLTEAEEITFTLRRTRKITIDGPAEQTRPGTGDSGDTASSGHSVVDAELVLDSDAIVSATTHLEPAAENALSGRAARGLPEPPSPRELPPGT